MIDIKKMIKLKQVIESTTSSWIFCTLISNINTFDIYRIYYYIDLMSILSYNIIILNA